MAPNEVYFGGGTDAAEKAYVSKLFVLIDFGEHARTFLRNCGVANEPSPDQAAVRFIEFLSKDPPTDQAEARGWFEFLARRSGGEQTFRLR